MIQSSSVQIELEPTFTLTSILTFNVHVKIDVITLIYWYKVKALAYGPQPISERVMPIIKERNDLGTPQKVRASTL